jgi:hypothetical protein
MRQIISLVLVLAVGALGVGCKKSEERTAQSVRTHMDYNYTYDKRDVFIEDASEDLGEMDQKITGLSGQAAAAGVLVKVEAQVKIQELRNRRTALGQKLNVLKDATQANWNDRKTDYQNSDAEIKGSLRTTSEWLAAKTHG